MRLKDEGNGELLVERDPNGGFVTLRIAGAARSSGPSGLSGSSSDAERVIHLTGEEARRLASLILFQAARLDRPRGWAVPVLVPLRQSA